MIVQSWIFPDVNCVIRATGKMGVETVFNPIRHFHIAHNTLCLSPPPLPKKTFCIPKHCFKFFLGRLHVPGEIENNAYAKDLGANKVYYGQYGNGEFILDICFSTASFNKTQI